MRHEGRTGKGTHGAQRNRHLAHRPFPCVDHIPREGDLDHVGGADDIWVTGEDQGQFLYGWIGFGEEAWWKEKILYLAGVAQLGDGLPGFEGRRVVRRKEGFCGRHLLGWGPNVSNLIFCYRSTAMAAASRWARRSAALGALLLARAPWG